MDKINSGGSEDASSFGKNTEPSPAEFSMESDELNNSKSRMEKPDVRYSVSDASKKVPKAMPAVGKTLIFPREDNIFMHKESIPYDEIQTQVWRDRPKRRSPEHIREWAAYFMLGFAVGTVAFVMSTIEELLSGWISETTQNLI